MKKIIVYTFNLINNLYASLPLVKNKIISSGVFALSIGILALLNFTACNEEFSPKTTVADAYVLNCVVETDGNNTYNTCTPTATISHVYDIDGYDPSSNTVDPAIKNAQVNLYIKGKAYKLEGQESRSENAKYGDYSYTYSALAEAHNNDTISIVAKLPNGKTLSAASRIPQDFGIELPYPYASGFTSQINRFLWGNSFVIKWKSTNSYAHLFFPSAQISYTKNENGVTNSYSVNVPAYYTYSDGKRTAVYPSYQQNMDYSIDFATIDTTMAMIAASDINHSVTFEKFIIKILEMDTPLSDYYSSIHGYVDHVSVRLDEGTYTNISGGIGIFGSSRVSAYKMNFEEEYLALFGY